MIVYITCKIHKISTAIKDVTTDLLNTHVNISTR